MAFSIVIICKNESRFISATLKSLIGVSDDIIVYDNGSTDNTLDIVRQFPVRLYCGEWEGFGKTKNKANALAKYDWILSLDADEQIDEDLKESLLQFDKGNERVIYKLRFRNYLGNKPLKHGEWGHDWHSRLFNRNIVSWDEAPVHEKLILPANIVKKKLKGLLLHHTAENVVEYANKMVHYAMLNAEKYYRLGVKPAWWKMYLSPRFNFLVYYFIKAGFLDGYEGFVCAKMTAYYTFLKYARLKELHKQKKE